MTRRARLWIEFVVIFGLLPIPAMQLPPRTLIPVLWVTSLAVLGFLLFDRTFERKQLWNAGAIRHHWRPIVLRFVFVAPVVAVATWLLTPQLFMGFPRRALPIWGMVMFAYPIASVFPQGIVYRAFLLHRYRDLFPAVALRVAVGALAFGYLHIIFGNWMAPMLTLAGGVLFTWTQEKTRSLFCSSLEHAMYGCLLITTGWGIFVVKGGDQILERLSAGG